MHAETLTVAQDLQVSFQNTLTQLNSGFASAVGQWIEHGGKFGRAMENMLVHLLTSFAEFWIKVAAQKAETSLYTAVTGKALAPAAGGAGGAGGAVQTNAFTAALTPATAAINAFTAALTPATTAQITQVPAVTAGTAAHAIHAPTVWASTQAHIGHAFAVIGSTFAHIGHAIAVAFSSIAHGIHAVAVYLSTASHLQHVLAVIADTIALIIHKLITLFTAGAATGGLVQGAGTGKSDSIPVMVSHGEYIVKADAVSKPGMLDVLHKINRGEGKPGDASGHAEGGYIAKFAGGGLVSEGSTLAFAGGGFIGSSSSAASFGHLARGHFAEGGVVGTNEAPAASITHNHNMRFQFAPTVNGSFDTEKEGEKMFDFMRNKLKRSGYNNI